MDYRRNEEKAMLEQFQEWVDFYDLILHNTCQYAIAIKFATRFKKQVFATLPGVPLSHLARKFSKSCQHQSHLPTVPSFAVSVT